jgi:2-keto-4-pentenoate hydratase/2-oxohepta-3-ene-1,7-dioic acid hydratase in catechol pathway
MTIFATKTGVFAERLTRASEFRFTTPAFNRSPTLPHSRIYFVFFHPERYDDTDARKAPFFFLKLADAIVEDGAEIAYPRMTHNYHQEIELVVAIGKPGRDVPIDKADDLIFGYAVGPNMTRHDLQLAARDEGRPWDTGKAFDESAPGGAITRKESAGNTDDSEL